MKKKNPRKLLKKKLDKLWSELIRRKYPRCIVCGTPHNLHAHHAICRKAQSDGVRWMLTNGVTLCVRHHLWYVHGQLANKMWWDRYLAIVNDLIPVAEQDNINSIAHKITKYTIPELEDMVREFEAKLSEIDHEKNPS
jgi:hypothetical protein